MVFMSLKMEAITSAAGKTGKLMDLESALDQRDKANTQVPLTKASKLAEYTGKQSHVSS